MSPLLSVVTTSVQSTTIPQTKGSSLEAIPNPTEVLEALAEAIVSLSKSAANASHPASALNFAAAANNLAEALAWVASPDQAHGGSAQGASNS